MRQTLIDSGPLVAFYSTRDQHHAWAFAQLDALRPPLLTCEPVLTEACFLLQRGAGRPATIIRAVREGVIKIAFDIETEAASLEVLMERYSDVPMSLADACLVRLSELYCDCRVLTLDSHFTRYRRYGRQVIPFLMPQNASIEMSLPVLATAATVAGSRHSSKKSSGFGIICE